MSSTMVHRRSAAATSSRTMPTTKDKHPSRDLAGGSAQQEDSNNGKQKAKVVWSSKVPFYPPSSKYWRIGNSWYDLSSFSHPGGQQILELARDRFEDATFAFEAHHHNYKAAKMILNKYLVPKHVHAQNQEVICAHRPSRQESAKGRNFPETTHHDQHLDANKHPELLGDDAFYSVLRQRVAAHLRKVNCKDGAPTWGNIVFFWCIFFAWLLLMCLTYRTGSFASAVVTGIFGAFLGAFGHNWVHQPRYKDMGWALLSLDTVGFSSDCWFRDHVLQHHMYTNTPWDNHYHGTDPFIVTDPTVSRNFLQQHVTPYLLHVFLCFGNYGNYINHMANLLRGQEVLSIGKIIFPLEHYIFWSRWGLHGLILLFIMNAVLNNYYFTIALMNHNTEHTTNMKKRNQACDFGEAQLRSCSDWCVNFSSFQSMLFLSLNFHTVHHCKSYTTRKCGM
jgi:hypothetical protein